jgi:hypothetical protein
MYNLLKTIAATNSYEFLYARRDFQNLLDSIPVGQVHLILDPVETTEAFTEYNEVDTVQSSGRFMLVISSDIDKGDYEQRYIDDIQPLLVGAMVIIKDALKCNGSIQIDSWRSVELINMFDYNVDGIAVTYQITQDV